MLVAGKMRRNQAAIIGAGIGAANSDAVGRSSRPRRRRRGLIAGGTLARRRVLARGLPARRRGARDPLTRLWGNRSQFWLRLWSGRTRRLHDGLCLRGLLARRGAFGRRRGGGLFGNGLFGDGCFRIGCHRRRVCSCRRRIGDGGLRRLIDRSRRRGGRGFGRPIRGFGGRVGRHRRGRTGRLRFRPIAPPSVPARQPAGKPPTPTQPAPRPTRREPATRAPVRRISQPRRRSPAVPARAARTAAPAADE